MRTRRARLSKTGLAGLFLLAVALGLLPVTPALAQATAQECPPGTDPNVICNGSGAGASELGSTLKGSFLFEPEFPLNSLKRLPIWNELEQLLDDPYRAVLCSSLSPGLQADGTTVSGLDQTTTGTTFIDGSPPPVVYPAYCSKGVVRRPGFGVALPPLYLHPLNYNPTDGEEMRLLNPAFTGAPWIVPDHLVQCGTPEALLLTDVRAGCAGIRTAIGPKGLVTSVGPSDSNRWVWHYVPATITPGGPRVLETSIDYNAPILPDPGLFPFQPTAFACEITTEVVPAEGSMICGGDPGEPGAPAFGSLATVGVNVTIDTFTISPASVCIANPLSALCLERSMALTLALTFPAGSPQRNFLCPNVTAPLVNLTGTGFIRTGVCTTSTPLQEPITPTSLALFVSFIKNSPNLQVRQTLVVQTVNQQQPSLAASYSTPAVPGGTVSTVNGTMFAGDITGKKLSDPFRGVINARDPVSGAGGLNKPSLRVPAAGGTPGNPNYLANRTDTGPVAADPSALMPSNENDYVINRTKAAVLGKSLFWEQQVGSDTVQACGSCHAHAGADNRTKNQMNPNDIGGDVTFEVGQLSPTLFGANHDLVASDFPIHKLVNPEIAGDPKCSPAITATIPAGVLENNFPGGVNNLTVCDKANIANQRPDGTDQNDVASSMGVHFGVFLDIPTPDPTPGGAAFNVLTDGVASLKPDLRSTVLADLIDPIPGFASDGTGTDVSGHQFRRVEPRNTPTVFAAALNFDNFWDGRARHDFNGGSVFGAADPQSHVFVSNGGGALTPTRQLIRFVSIASLATGPGLSQFEMSFRGRNWAKIGKKLLQNGVTPLAEQLVDPTDGVLGPYSNQGGSLCAGLPASDRSPAGGTPTTLGAGVPGLCISYPALIRSAFYPALHNNANRHLNGCYTDGRPDIHPNQCAAGINDPFDGYVLSIANGAAVATDTNQFTQMEGNFSLFWGLSIAVWGTLLLPDNTPFDQFMDANPDMFESIGEVGEPGLVGPMPVCTTSTQRHCFREVPGNNFKRDSSFADPNANNCLFPHAGEGVITQTLVSVSPCKGTRDPNSNAPDPLLGMDIFQGSNFSLKNPNFRAARCAECHAGATLTDNTMPFTHKAQLGDFIGEFITAGNEALVEPLGMTRVITGFLLEDELNSNGQDAIERRIINQSIVPCPTGTLTAGLAFPDGVAGPFGLETLSGIGHGLCEGAGSAFFDNGVYNLGVTICEADQSQVTGRCDDNGRGNTDAFGWPMSLAALLMKNLGGNGGAPCTDSANCSTEPGQPLVNFDPALGNGGGLFEETAQDQTLNPGEDDDAVNPLLPPYLAPFASRIPVGDCMPELDEIHGGINTLTDIAITEGFIDVVGPFNPAGILNESMNSGDGPEMGNWPLVNRVGRFGSIKAAQLREVELTGPYFHNGGKLTLRQVVDFYSRGGDYPITNATHRDFNIVNLTIEKQSNLSEAEKVALVDFLLELTDDRVRFERAPFDHPQAILPLDGTAPENTGGRAAMLAGCVALPAGNVLGPGQRSCAGGMFLDVPATGGTVGNGGFALPNFLGVTKDRGTNGTSGFNCDPASGPISHYCH